MVRLALRSPADGRSRRQGLQAPAHGTTRLINREEFTPADALATA